MIFVSIADFARVLCAFLFVFIFVPLVGEGYRLWKGEPFEKPPEEWIPITFRAFVRASFAVEISAVLLGHLRLCLPGVVVGGCLLWCTRGVWVGFKRQTLLGERDSHTLWRAVFAHLDKGSSLGSRLKRPVFRCGSLFRSARSKLFLALIGASLLIELWIPLRQVHFDHQESYLRAVSLAALTQGQSWDGDGSVAILAPLVSFSGLNAAPVVRFTGPILAVLLALAIAACVWRVWRSSTAALLMLFFFAAVSVAAGSPNWELLPASIALVYGMSAVASWPGSRRDGYLAALTALMISPTEWTLLFLCGLILIGVFLSSRACALNQAWPAALLTTVISLCSIVFVQRGEAGTPAYHYESAARTCEAIGRSFHRNEWLLVSPFQELACSYGQGWHVELSSVVSEFSVEQVSKANFSFPYDVPDVFFFIERRPLRVGIRPENPQAIWRYSPAGSADWSAFLYSDPIGRASLEYRAAELLNAYSETHRNVSLFYGDADLLVYHLVRPAAGT